MHKDRCVIIVRFWDFYLGSSRRRNGNGNHGNVAGASVGAAVVAAEAVAGAVGVGVAGRPAVGARVPRALVLGPGRRHWALQRRMALLYWPWPTNK